MHNKRPYVYIVGAGLGAPDLISLRGLNAIKDADVILYDALVNKQLLKHAKRASVIKFVGKRSQDHSYSQDQINQLIIEHAYNYGKVVRLKGGDPFIFGRGKEEVDYIESFNISYEIIPGISSSTGAASLSSLPLTKRGINESFWVITAVNRNNQLSKDIELASKSSSTIVLLMGSKKIKEIQEIFIDSGKLNTPVAFIENASMPNHKTIISNVREMFSSSIENNIKSPVIIVIGESIQSPIYFSNQLIKKQYEKL